MTSHEAKELSLEVWRYLAEHPEIDEKGNLPVKLYKKIKEFLNECPLCDHKKILCFKAPGRIECPLKGCGIHKMWLYAENNEDRQAAAQKIVDAIEAWEPKEVK
jgi:hypothetical protein